MAKFVEFRAYVGPEWLPKTSTYHYDWSSHSVGGLTDFTFSTTLTAQLSSSGITATVASASAFPSVGGAWIGPAAGTEGWEYCRYNGKTATTLNALVRVTNNREHTGVHSSGAKVYFWYPITTDDGNLNWSWQSNDQWNTSYWTATLSGVLAPKNVLRLGHAVVVQRRTTPTGSFSNWLYGWITEAQTTDSNNYDSPWSVTFASSPVMIAKDEAPVFAVGEINLAAGGSAQASSTLASSWKERDSGDYIAAYPSFDAGNVSDDESDSIWISEKYVSAGFTEYVVGGPGVGTTVNDMSLGLSGGRLLSDALMITQIHLSLAPGQPDGYRWIEITAMADFTFVAKELYLGAEDGDTLVFGGTIEGYVTDKMSAMKTGDRVIICENADRFAEDNPDCPAQQIISLIDLNQPNYLKDRALSGGSLGLWRASASGNAWLHRVCWGTSTTATIGVWSQTSPTWPGTTIAAMTTNSGKTLRYNWANSATSASNWTYDMVHYPGYKLGNSKYKQYVMVKMPVMGLTLKTGISSGYTGLVTLTTPGGDSSAGLERSGSFTIQIGSEQMTAFVSNSSQVNVTARAQNGTTAAAHVAGDPVYIVVSGVATDAYKVKQLKWARSGGTIYPKNFKVYTSTMDSPRAPGETGYTADWATPTTVTNNTSATWASSALTVRPKWVLIEFDLMTTDPARARLNTVTAIIDNATFDSATWLASGDAADLIVSILGYVGVPVGAISNLYTGTNMTSNSTAKGGAWSVISDICDFASLRIDVDQMSKLTISADNFWTASIFTPIATWTRANSNQPSFGASANTNVSQVQINWKLPDGTAGSSVYPASPDGYGKIETLDDMIFENSGAADIAAQKRYLMSKYSWSMTIMPTIDDATTNKAGEFHTVQWTIDPSLPDINRTFLATNVQHTFAGRSQSTVISGIEIERYSNEQ